MYKNNIFHKKTQKKRRKQSKTGKTTIFFKQPPTRPQRSVGGVFTTPVVGVCTWQTMQENATESK